MFVDGGLDVDGVGGNALLVEGVDGLDVGDDRSVVILVAVVVVVVVVLVVVDVVEVDVEDFVVGSNIVIGF